MKFLKSLFFSLLALSIPAQAQVKNLLTGPQVTVQTDGTNSVGAVNIATQNAGRINFFTNNSLRGYIDASTGVLTGFTISVAGLTLPNNTYLLARNAANTADLDLLKADSSDRTILNHLAGATTRLTTSSSSNNYLEFSGGATSATLNLTDSTRNFRAYADATGVGVGTTSAHDLSLVAGGTARVKLDNTNNAFVPATAAGYKLGRAPVPWGDFFSGDGTSTVGITNSGGAGYIGTYTNHPFSLYSNNVTRLTLAADGSSLTANQAMLITTSGASALNLGISGIARWGVDTSASWVQAAGGGNIVMTVPSTSVRQTVVTGITAAGTTTSDATALTGVLNYVTTTAAGTGVKLWEAGLGSVIYVHNLGANALLVYPPTSGQIYEYAVDAGASVASGSMAICTKRAASGGSSWYCGEMGVA